ncbi:hypothetical protein ACFY0G_02730 [Streptomyces sp. NPDC001552]|uniref:hypothetical protein n=1 Tax=Streptomyces sp. NPDC001552 TaxID=3364587 RepID=UPI0036AE7F8C
MSAEPAASGAVDGEAEVRTVYWTYSDAPTTWGSPRTVALALVGVFGGATGAMSASAAQALRPTVLVGGLTLLAATVFCLVQVVRETRSR